MRFDVELIKEDNGFSVRAFESDIKAGMKIDYLFLIMTI